MKKFLETERLIIKPPQLSDYENLHHLHSDPQIMKYFKVNSATESLESLQKAIAHFEKYGYSHGLVYKKETFEFVGRGGLIHALYDETQDDIELGYSFLQEHWGQGYATELATALVQWGFTQLSINKIVAHTSFANLASTHVLDKIGMHYVKPSLYINMETAEYEIYRPK